MHFCLVFRSLETGGIQTLMVRMAQWLGDRGHDVTVLASVDGPMRGSFPAGTHVVVDEAATRTLCAGGRGAGRRFRANHLAGREVDAFFAFSDEALWICAGILKGQEKPARVLSGAFGPADYGIGRVGRRRAWISALLYPESHLFLHHLPPPCRLYMNRGVEDLVTGALGEPAPGLIWPIPVDGKRPGAVRRSPQRGLIVSVGRLVQMKEYNLWMIDVVDALRRAGHDIRWEVYGDGPLRPQMERRIEALGLHEHVRIAGEIPYERMMSVFERAWAFVGMGTALIEAGFAGVPAIVAPIFHHEPVSYGFLDAIPEYSCGEDVDMPKRPVADFVVELLARDDVAYANLAEAQRRHARRFDIDELMERFLRIVDDSPAFERLWHPGWLHAGLRPIRSVRQAMRST